MPDAVCARAQQPGRFYCDDKGDLYSVGYDDQGTHKTVSRLVDHCGSPNQCSQYDGVCRTKRCVIGQTTCVGADVYSCDTGERRIRTATRCSSATRCQDGFGCVKALSIAAGDAHTCVVVAGADAIEGDPGYVMCWGANESGQLGDGSPLFADSKEARPVLIGPGPGDGSGSSVPATDQLLFRECPRARTSPALTSWSRARWAARAARSWRAGAPTRKGSWGRPMLTLLPAQRAFYARHRPARHRQRSRFARCDLRFRVCVCARQHGTSWCWGANESGQLGNGSTEAANAATPMRALDLRSAERWRSTRVRHQVRRHRLVLG